MMEWILEDRKERGDPSFGAKRIVCCYKCPLESKGKNVLRGLVEHHVNSLDLFKDWYDENF